MNVMIVVPFVAPDHPLEVSEGEPSLTCAQRASSNPNGDQTHQTPCAEESASTVIVITTGERRTR